MNELQQISLQHVPELTLMLRLLKFEESTYAH